MKWTSAGPYLIIKAFPAENTVGCTREKSSAEYGTAQIMSGPDNDVSRAYVYLGSDSESHRAE